ncbi:MAG: class II fructose-bisphosphate aldolase [Gammaproteobacteria bacterium]|nr:class II fructose-bisphosphate aldolase [Gammaproteobacteria bacterium]
MPIMTMKAMLDHAYQHGYAVGAFAVVNLDFVSATLAAAERSRSPVILSLAQPRFDDPDFALLMPAVEAAAQRATVPVAIQFDDATTLSAVVRAINLGCNGVMFDASPHPFHLNVELTREVTSIAHGCGVPVEGALGDLMGVAGKEADAHSGERVSRDISQVKTYVQLTGIDSLAIVIGTGDGETQEDHQINHSRLQALNKALAMPLVLHQGSDLATAEYRLLIANGICKINDCTALAQAAGSRLQQNLAAGRQGYTSLMAGVRDAISEAAEQRMRQWGAAGRADALLQVSPPWAPVEHLIVYNAVADDNAIMAMMAEGRQRLAAIPGVREVFTGCAIQAGARYRFSWLIRFSHPAVIDSYRNHPDHLAFADNLFRPIAGDRISIDYQGIAATAFPHLQG